MAAAMAREGARDRAKTGSEIEEARSRGGGRYLEVEGDLGVGGANAGREGGPGGALGQTICARGTQQALYID
eukprot:1486511-Pyramimonas_sp.AAC.1